MGKGCGSTLGFIELLIFAHSDLPVLIEISRFCVCTYIHICKIIFTVVSYFSIVCINDFQRVFLAILLYLGKHFNCTGKQSQVLTIVK